MNEAYFIIYNRAVKIIYDKMYSDKIKKIIGFCYKAYNQAIVAEISLLNGCLEVKYNNILESYKCSEQTDIYPIIYSVIYKLMNENNAIMMHSSVVSNKNGEGILILGDFGAGKTTLMKEFVKNGWLANSTDQSLLKIKNNALWFYCGSVYYGEEEKDISYNDSVATVKIKKIIIIDSLVGKKEFVNKIIKEEKVKFRKIWAHIFWPWVTPLVGSGNLISLESNQLSYMNDLCKKISKIFETVYAVRGSKTRCVEEFLF